MITSGRGELKLFLKTVSNYACACRKHLELLLQKEKADNSDRDRMIEEAAAQQSARLEAEQAARAAARKRLMDDQLAK